MPKEGYLVLVDPAEAHDAWKKDQTRWKKYVAAHYTKMLVKGGLAYAVNHFTFSIGGVIFEGPGIVKTDLHLKRLFEIQTNNKHYPCYCKKVEGGLTCGQILDYTIEQKLKKYGRRIVRSIPVVGSAAALGAKIEGVTKTDRGGKREQYAKILREKAQSDCPKAQAIVAELLGSYRSQDSWKETFSLAAWGDGWKVLKEKMAST
jgi:hypothetical protein